MGWPWQEWHDAREVEENDHLLGWPVQMLLMHSSVLGLRAGRKMTVQQSLAIRSIASTPSSVNSFEPLRALATQDFSHFNAVCGNIGALLFIIGSVLLYPENEHKCSPHFPCGRLGALLFVVGSTLFWLGCVLLLVRISYLSRQREGESYDIGLVANTWLYFVSDLLYIIGSVFFFPSLEKSITGNTSGTYGSWVFMLGSVGFMIAPCVDIIRGHKALREHKTSRQAFALELTFLSFYVAGGFLFFLGSVLLLGAETLDGETNCITLFVVGSVCFQTATLIAYCGFCCGDKPDTSSSLSSDLEYSSVSDLDSTHLTDIHSHEDTLRYTSSLN